MSGVLEMVYEEARLGVWAHPDKDRCPCHGGGWFLSDLDIWFECPCHYRGQPHPDDYEHCVTDEDVAAVEAAAIERWEARRRPAAPVPAAPPPGFDFDTPDDGEDIPF